MNSKLTQIWSFIHKNVEEGLKACTWEKEGLDILGKSKETISLQEKRILKFLLIKEISHEYRCKLWLELSGANMKMLENRLYYKNLIRYAQKVGSLDEFQIKIDLKRTFPKDDFFRQSSNLNKLKRILLCYSVRNSSIGYCQGFNFIAAKLLKVLNDEEQAFWTFTCIIEEILPINYYSELVGIITDCSIIKLLVEKYLPKFYKFLMFHDMEINLNNFIHKWLITLFLQTLNEEISSTVWDFFFLEGDIVIIKTCLAIMKAIEKKAMKCEMFEDIYQVMSSEPALITDKFVIAYYLSIKIFEFDSIIIYKLRADLQKPIIENIEQEEKLNHQKRQISSCDEDDKKNCNRSLPYCLNNKTRNIQRKFFLFLVFHINYSNIFINEEYFTKVAKDGSHKYKEISSGCLDTDDHLFLQRNPHSCMDYIDEHICYNDERKADRNADEIQNNSTSEENKDCHSRRTTNSLADTSMISEHFEAYPQVYQLIKNDDNYKEFNKNFGATFHAKPLMDLDY